MFTSSGTIKTSLLITFTNLHLNLNFCYFCAHFKNMNCDNFDGSSFQRIYSLLLPLFLRRRGIFGRSGALITRLRVLQHVSFFSFYLLFSLQCKLLILPEIILNSAHSGVHQNFHPFRYANMANYNRAIIVKYNIATVEYSNISIMENSNNANISSWYTPMPKRSQWPINQQV